MTVDELNEEELEELILRYYIEVEDTENISLDSIKAYYSGIHFVKDDFFCNVNYHPRQSRWGELQESTL